MKKSVLYKASECGLCYAQLSRMCALQNNFGHLSKNLQNLSNLTQHNKFAQFSMRFDLKFFYISTILDGDFEGKELRGTKRQNVHHQQKRYKQRSQLCKSWSCLLKSGCLADWEEIMILTKVLQGCRCSLAKIGSRWKSQTTERLQVHSSRKSGSRR